MYESTVIYSLQVKKSTPQKIGETMAGEQMTNQTTETISATIQPASTMSATEPETVSSIVEADSRLIHWLLHDSGVSRYRISKLVGISESTLSRIAGGETPMDAVRFGYAHKLTACARDLRRERGGLDE